SAEIRRAPRSSHRRPPTALQDGARIPEGGPKRTDPPTPRNRHGRARHGRLAHAQRLDRPLAGARRAAAGRRLDLITLPGTAAAIRCRLFWSGEPVAVRAGADSETLCRAAGRRRPERSETLEPDCVPCPQGA